MLADERRGADVDPPGRLRDDQQLRGQQDFPPHDEFLQVAAGQGARGRLLAARDDLEGARASFVAALDREIDFVDALVALGELARRTEDLWLKVEPLVARAGTPLLGGGDAA